MQFIVSAIGAIAAVAFAVAPQFDAVNPKTAAWLTLLGTAATATGGALTKFGWENKIVTVLGVIVAVSAVIAGATDLIPTNYALIASVLGTAAAALGKSLFGWEAEPTPEGPTTNAFKAIAGLLIVGTLAGGFTACAKKIPGETPEQYKTRALAIRTAQGYVAFDMLQDTLIALEDYQVIGDAAAPKYYVLHDRALSAMDVVSQRLQSGLPADTVDKIDAVIVDLDKILAELQLIQDPNVQAKAAQVVSSIRLTLSSIKVIIAAQNAAKEPSAGELRKLYNEAMKSKGPQPGWWNAVISIIADKTAQMLFISAYTDPQQAWTEGADLSKAMHAENRNRAPEQLDK